MKLKYSKPSKKTVYIAGKMRGIKNNNFPAFDRAKEKALSLGFDVFSPADMDRQDDQNVMKTLTEAERQEIYAIRDVDAVMRSTHIAMLPGWETSIGARAEYFMAQWLFKEILDAETFEPLEDFEVIIKKKEMQNA